MANNSHLATPVPLGMDILGTNMQSSDHAVIVSANILIGTLGILGNGAVILVYVMNPKMTRSLTSLFIFHQSIIDLLSSIIFLAIRLDTWRPLLTSGVSDIACRLWYSEYLLWVMVMTSTLNLLLVSMERYVCISHHIFHRNHFTRRRAKLSMAVAWLVSLVYQSYWAAVSTALPGGECEPRWFSEAMQTFFGITTFFVEYLIPLVLMTFSYTRIISRLNQRCRVSALHEARTYMPRDALGSASTAPNPSHQLSQITQPPTSTHSRIVMLSEAKKNVVKTLCIVFATYVICWTPTELEYLVYNLGGSLDFDGPFHRVTVILVLCNMCINPIIYALKYREFQNSMKRMLKNWYQTIRQGRAEQSGSENEQFNLRQLNSHSPITPRHYSEYAMDNVSMRI